MMTFVQLSLRNLGQVKLETTDGQQIPYLDVWWSDGTGGALVIYQ